MSSAAGYYRYRFPLGDGSSINPPALYGIDADNALHAAKEWIFNFAYELMDSIKGDPELISHEHAPEEAAHA